MPAVHAINHIGIAVRCLEEHRVFYAEVLGAQFEGEEEVASQQVRVAFYKVGDVRLELLEPTGPESPLARFIDKRGEGLHHVAYTVDDLRQRIVELKEAGVHMIDQTPRLGAHHMQIAFLHPKSSGGVLTELCEPGK